jgi:transposase
MKITRVGLDIAKQVFQVHGVDEPGKAPESIYPH